MRTKKFLRSQNFFRTGPPGTGRRLNPEMSAGRCAAAPPRAVPARARRAYFLIARRAALRLERPGCAEITEHVPGAAHKLSDFSATSTTKNIEISMISFDYAQV